LGIGEFQEVAMKRLVTMAVVLLASSAAQAQYQFEYGGRTIRIDPDRGTVSIPGVYDNTGRKSKRAKGDQDTVHGKSAPQDAKTDYKTDYQNPDAQTAPPPPAPGSMPADTASAPPPPPPPPPGNNVTGTDQPTTTANSAPSDSTALPQQQSAAPPPPPAPLPPLQQQDSSRPVQQPSTMAAVPPPPPPAQIQRDPNSPVGVWLTEEKEGKVRIEPCGANLCGFAVDAKSNANGEKVLINMRPGSGKWSGRILDPKSGSTYDSTIAMKGPDVLRVQGCAFGGMFCGGQTWTRVN
jgi:uncharacterized protein (DUF2147 family)